MLADPSPRRASAIDIHSAKTLPRWGRLPWPTKVAASPAAAALLTMRGRLVRHGLQTTNDRRAPAPPRTYGAGELEDSIDWRLSLPALNESVMIRWIVPQAPSQRSLWALSPRKSLASGVAAAA